MKSLKCESDNLFVAVLLQSKKLPLNKVLTGSVKIYLGRLMVLLTLLTISTGFLSAQTAINPEEFWSNKLDQKNSDSFKTLVSGNRLSLFMQLQELIRVVELSGDVAATGNAIGTHITTKEEIVYLLGEPDNKIVMSMYEYNLKGSTSLCKVIIGFDAAGNVNFYSVKDCN